MKKQLTLKDYEAHIASMCVAIVSGGIGGGLTSLIYNQLFIFGLTAPIAAPAIGGYAVAWLVCKFLFPSAHKWYGHGSWSHRIYDLVGIVSGVRIYWLVR